MDLRKKIFMAVLALNLTSLCHAVNLSTNGHGEVLLYPYYTVNNEMNTIYSVVNLTEQTKAIKIRILEGEAGMEVLDFNVYLSAYDVWTSVLISAVSDLPGHVGEPTALHVTSDTSCAPFLNKTGQQVLPYIIDTDAPNDSLQRATDGHIEIIEMATFTGATVAAADHGEDGIPASCSTITDFWGMGFWTGDTEHLPTGGLAGSASVINVGDGLDFSYNAVALEDFWQGFGSHTEPGSLFPHLGSAAPQSQVLLNNQLHISDWATGIEAVSAVLMQSSIINEYAFDAAVLGKSEWVLTFPTKNIHTIDNNPALPPFDTIWNGTAACEEFSINVWDRESQVKSPGNSGISPQPPVGVNPSMCYHSNVMEFISGKQSPAPTSSIFGADNLVTVEGVDSAIATENGWVKVEFFAATQNMTPLSGTGYQGLPVIGFQVQQITNNNAQPGLIAQYGRLFSHKGVTFEN